jgi:hypothetical protein
MQSKIRRQFRRQRRTTTMQSLRRSIGRHRAIALFESSWWVERSPREIAKFQLLTRELCLPFALFHRAVEEALGRSVWMHEFGFDVGGLLQDLLGERDAPDMHEILDLLPTDKRQVLFLEECSDCDSRG